MGEYTQMLITADTASGNYIKVEKIDDTIKEGQTVGKDPVAAEKMSPEEVQEIYDRPEGFKYVALILHAHASPGCWIYFIAGQYYKICVPQ